MTKFDIENLNARYSLLPLVLFDQIRYLIFMKKIILFASLLIANAISITANAMSLL